jgi:hypothetical protein
MALALARSASTFRTQKHLRSRMWNLSLLMLQFLKGQSRLLGTVIVLTVLEPLWRYVLIGRNDGELLKSIGWSKQQSTRPLGIEEIIQT